MFSTSKLRLGLSLEEKNGGTHMQKTSFFSPKEIANMLNIGDSTLRKWCIALEEHGYFFSRTDNKRRMFFDKDIIVLKHLRELVQVQNLSLDNASKVVTSKYKQDEKNASAQQNSENNERSLESDTQKIMDKLEQLESFNKTLLDTIAKQQEYIEERLNKHEERIEKRDLMLMESLREVQETKRLMIEAKEEEKKKPVRKGILSWFIKE
jgi:DNA-binding transcriptional MerR regulator